MRGEKSLSEKEQILSEAKEFSFLTARMLFAMKADRMYHALNDAYSLRMNLETLITRLNMVIQKEGSK